MTTTQGIEFLNVVHSNTFKKPIKVQVLNGVLEWKTPLKVFVLHSDGFWYELGTNNKYGNPTAEGWILEDGSWDDDGTFFDNAAWNDGV